jgi:hypothetical protein
LPGSSFAAKVTVLIVFCYFGDFFMSFDAVWSNIKKFQGASFSTYQGVSFEYIVLKEEDGSETLIHNAVTRYSDTRKVKNWEIPQDEIKEAWEAFKTQRQTKTSDIPGQKQSYKWGILADPRISGWQALQ